MIAERLTAQLLAGPPAPDPVAVAERLLATQAQDLRGARLAVRARTAGLSVAALERAFGDRALVISWLNRGTLHLVRSEDYPWLQALTTPPLSAGNARRLAQEGVASAAAERGVSVVVRALAEEGPLGRAALRERLDAAGVRTQGQALVHILMLASLQGHVVRGPFDGARSPLRPRAGLARTAATRRPRCGARRARPPLPGRARPSRRPRSRPLGRPPAARRARGPERDRVRARAATGRARRTRGAAGSGRDAAAAAARPVRAAAPRLALTRAAARLAHGRRDPQRDLPTDRPRPRPRGRHVAARGRCARAGAVPPDLARRPGRTRRRRARTSSASSAARNSRAAGRVAGQ